jgi:hypothetical protein
MYMKIGVVMMWMVMTMTKRRKRRREERSEWRSYMTDCSIWL